MAEKKKIILEFDEDYKYFKFIEDYRIHRELSFTAAAKLLLQTKIDELIKEENVRYDDVIMNKTTDADAGQTPKKDMLKNLHKRK